MRSPHDPGNTERIKEGQPYIEEVCIPNRSSRFKLA
jgi:hypothetical protein